MRVRTYMMVLVVGAASVALGFRFERRIGDETPTVRIDGFEGPAQIRQFEGGQSNPTFRLDAQSGAYVLRKGGWDTHGLPVEIEVEKELGLKHKHEIEEYGIAEYNAKCRDSVFRYIKDWERLTELDPDLARPMAMASRSYPARPP